jgi:uncharacterized membrane protein
MTTITNTKRTRPSAVTTLLVVLAFQLVAGGSASAQEDGSANYEKLGAAIGKTLYFFAWPTATYESATFGGIARAASGLNVVFRLHGKSAFDDGYLWTDVVLLIRNWQIVDLKWGQNNAALMAPGATMKAMGEALHELNNEVARTQRPASQFVFTNQCGHPLQLAIEYQGVDGQWHRAGWWSFASGETSTLQFDGQTLTTSNDVWYFYAEATDDSGLIWKGRHRVSADGRDLPMAKVQDAEGDREWSATCSE